MNNYSEFGCKQAKSSAWRQLFVRMYGTWRILWTVMAEKKQQARQQVAHPLSNGGMFIFAGYLEDISEAETF